MDSPIARARGTSCSRDRLRVGTRRCSSGFESASWYSALYYARQFNATTRGGHAAQFEILRTPADGSAPLPIWRGSPGESIASLADVEDHWLGVGEYYLGDGQSHAVVVEIAADGSERLLACSPDAGSTIASPVLFEHTLYLLNSSGDAWQVVNVALDQ